MSHHENNQTHLYVNPKSVATRSTLERTGEVESDYLNQATYLLEVTQQEYKDLDPLERVERSEDLKAETEELKDLLKGPESDLMKWIEKEPVVVEGIAFATELRSGVKKPASSKERNRMQEQVESVLCRMFRRAEELEYDLTKGDLRDKRARDINRNLAHLRKASYVITLEVARKKELDLW